MTGHFNPAFPVERLRPALYNPRMIDSESRRALQESISKLGFAKPVIVLSDGLTIAGHQRGNAARALGLETVPAYVLPEVGESDEVRFNQLHNGTDLDECDPMPRVLGSVQLGFQMVPAHDVDGVSRATGVPARVSMMRLLVQYGNWGGAIVSQSGEVLSGANYLLSCRQLRWPSRVFGVPTSDETEALDYLRRPYGVFSYAHLERTTWRQSFAQLPRLLPAANDHGKSNDKSTLYETIVLPDLAPRSRLLDFGAGRGGYARRLRTLGHAAFDVEFFRRVKKTSNLDIEEVHAMIDRLIASLVSDGRFPHVVCDCVLNSVDSPEAESDVVRCVAAMTLPGGRVYLAGRSKQIHEYLGNATRFANKNSIKSGVSFLDEHGLTATYHRGGWFFQKFHSDADVAALVAQFGERVKFTTGSGMWQTLITKTHEVPAELSEDAIRREFNLPWPNGMSVGRGEDVVQAWRTAMARE